MKRLLLVVAAVAVAPALARAAYPQDFSWGGALGAAPDQLRLGPCYTFAALGVVERMNDLFYGPSDPSLGAVANTDLSELHVYSCGGSASMAEALGVIEGAGAVYTSCSSSLAYPTGACMEAQDQEPNKLIKASLGCATLQKACGRRVTARFREVTGEMQSDGAIQSLLVNAGPIAIFFGVDPAHGASHGVVLYGWQTNANTGQLEWLVRDTWPCKASAGGRPFAQLQLPATLRTYDSRAWVVERVDPAYWDGGSWIPLSPAIRPFTLPAASQVVKLAPGPCFNAGEITVTGLERLPGAEITGWSLQTENPGLRLSVQNGRASLSGTAYTARVTVTIRRANGLLENVTQDMGPVGYPVEVVRRTDACAGTRREVSLTAQALTPVSSWSFHFGSSPRGSYYVMGDDGPSPYIVFTAVDSAPYRLTVNGGPAGCSTTINGYVMGMPCITYPYPGYPYGSW